MLPASRLNLQKGWTKVVRKKGKGLCTSVSVLVAISKSTTGVIPTQGDIPKAIKKHESRITTVWIDFRGGIYMFAVYFCYSEGMSTKKEQLQCLAYDTGSLGAMRNMEPDRAFLERSSVTKNTSIAYVSIGTA